MKEIIEELGLEGAKPADIPMIVSQSGKMDSDSRALSLRDATLYRRLVADHLDALHMESASDQTTSWHTLTVFGQQIEKTGAQ